MYLAIAGNIGAGKSSLTRILADHYQLRPIYEAVDQNPYLEDFYRDMRRFAFPSQVFFLATRLEQHLAQVNPAERVIQDRTIYEDAAVFARNLLESGAMEQRDWESYRRLYQAIVAALRPPDLLVYLRASLPTLRARIAQRGRGYEATISDDYLLRLNRLYDGWIAGFELAEVVVVDSDGLDFVHNRRDLALVLAQLERHGLTAPLMRSGGI